MRKPTTPWELNKWGGYQLKGIPPRRFDENMNEVPTHIREGNRLVPNPAYRDAPYQQEYFFSEKELNR
jgi:hypothetical protein